MQHTADMFGMPAIARKRDPDTSKSAAVQHDAGARGADKQMVLELIQKYPGKTAAEYSDLLRSRGVHWYRAARMTTKRISDLRDCLIIGKTKKCSITGKRAQTYFPGAPA